jgi:hypothetical protein
MMKDPGLSRESYSDATALSAALSPAHSGPELASCVPDPGLAQELARELLADHFELTQFNTHANSAHASSGMNAGFTIGLARR